jgi:hypothetical protein
MPYSLQSVSGEPITLPANVIISTIPESGVFTVKIGSRLTTHQSLKGLIDRINSECDLQKKRKIPSDAVLVPLETKEEVILPKAYASLAKPEPEEQDAESEKRGLTLAELNYKYLFPLLLITEMLLPQVIECIKALLKLGFTVSSSRKPKSEFTENNISFINQWEVGFKVYKKDSTASELEPHCILCFGDFVRPRLGLGTIYISPTIEDMSIDRFHDVKKMKPTMEAFVIMKVNEILA